jgi:hypothetical protein
MERVEGVKTGNENGFPSQMNRLSKEESKPQI